MNSIDLVGFFLLHDILTFVDYLMQKQILVEEQLMYYLKPVAGKNKRVHTFPKAISPKVNVIECLEFESNSL